MDDKKVIDPLALTEKDMPLFVLSSHSYDVISWLIRLKTKSNYNHIMIMINPGLVASQDLLYRERPIKDYLIKGIKLKFWKIDNLSDIEKLAIIEKVRNELNAPWWRRHYDFLGIVGQLFNLKKLNAPLGKYCSERVARYIRILFPDFPTQPSPEDMNALFKTMPRMSVLGYWFSD